MWTCINCNTEVEDQFENCPQCGTGRDGSEPPVDFVRKADALQPELPSTGSSNNRSPKRWISVIAVIAVIIVLLIIALGGRQ